MMTDVFKKHIIAVHARGQSAATTTKVLVKEWISKFGVPYQREARSQSAVLPAPQRPRSDLRSCRHPPALQAERHTQVQDNILPPGRKLTVREVKQESLGGTSITGEEEVAGSLPTLFILTTEYIQHTSLKQSKLRYY